MSNLCKNFTKIITQVATNRLYSSSYKSAISLDSLYPTSSLKLATPKKPPNEGQDKFTGYIPIEELDITYSRSSGPGGQNVNKVNTKVEVRFNISSASWINDDLKSKLLEKYKNKITKEGFIIFRSDVTRSQHLNLADCLEKIRSSVRSCVVVEQEPSDETAEKLRRRFERATRERLALKRTRSQVKSNRQTPLVNL
ncbi:large ribosomal subunit protein mL62 [Zophobas morio]|uniref:large ribosomal subunit protein mL62 n=1 Tax=Zophobas morio TaxID=2755281 RepID=UPI003082914D